MDKLDEFKQFIKDKPYLANDVRDQKITWQTLYETYDMFGPDHDFFKAPNLESNKTENISDEERKNEESSSKPASNDTVGRFFKQLQKIDTQKISDGLENVKKIVGLIDEFRPNLASSSKLASSRIKPFRKYND